VSTEALLARHVAECARLGLRGEVRAVEQRRAELVARNGVIESEGVTRESVVSLAAGDGTGTVLVSGGIDVDPAIMAAEARTLLGCTTSETRRSGPAARPGTRRHPGRRAAFNESRDRVAAFSVVKSARECELRTVETTRTVHYVTPEATQTYQTSHASAVLRATRDDGDGQPVHVDLADSGADLSGLLDGFAGQEIPGCLQHLHADPLPPAAGLPTTVVVGRHVAAQLLWLFSEALSVEAVVQGRSRLAGRIGEQVGSSLITIVDDPCHPHGPRHLPCDDEGVPAERRVLIERGRLAGFLGSRAYQAGCAQPGNARQADPATAPRPAASNLFLSPDVARLSHGGPVLRITQTHGMHLANPITGDFSAGASGLVVDGAEIRRVAGLAVAGNVFDMYARTEAIGDRLSWVDDGESSFGSPDLRVSGLTIGR
jgi:PmbA protein